ncbi:unnamed protein product [Ectocarpus sp. 12 AP-2014]
MEPPSACGTTTRSGRISIPVLDFWRSESSLGEKATESRASGWQHPRTSTENKPPATSENTISGWQHTRTSTENKPPVSSENTISGWQHPRANTDKPRASSECTIAEGGVPSTRTECGDSLPARSRRARVMTDASNRARAVASSHERHDAAGRASNTPRGVAPVLDWWRSQRLTKTPNVGVVGAARFPVGQPSTGNHADMDSACGLETVGREVNGGEKPWTKAQMHSLRRAQAETAPSTSAFWSAVACNVDGRNPQECQQKWFEHFATPRGRSRNASARGYISQRIGTPPSDDMSRNTPAAAVYRSLAPAKRTPERGASDDLFQATPIRGQRRFGVQARGDLLDTRTPRTPAGPGAPCRDSSALDAAPGCEHADYKRGVSRKYVKTLSKRMRKGALQSGKNRKAARGQAVRKPESGVAGRTTHTAAVSGGHKLQVSVSGSGAVSVQSICDSSDEGNSSVSDYVESDDDDTR